LISLFRHLCSFFQTKMLEPGDYEIVFRCRSQRARMLLELAIEREFAQLTMNFPTDYPPVRGSAGTCSGIKFEVSE